tara:strand:+ start:1531 stop:2361 length:831 start_codon:yes stop_codon:yes gene_type:complete
MKKKIYIINGEAVNSSEAKISVDDYGLMRGYAVFETIRFKNKKALGVNSHINRLLRSISFIKMDSDKIKRDCIISDINRIIEINGWKNGLIKIIVTKGLPKNNQKTKLSPNIYMTIKEIYDIPKDPVKVVFYNESKYPILRFNPAIKSINYLGNMMAIEDANRNGAFEVVFYNNDNLITECAMRNIFFIRDDNLITPKLDLGILPGTTRKMISSLSDNVNLKYVEEEILIDNINLMDEAFICSSVVGVLPCLWDGWKSDFKLTKRLQFLLEESLEK